MNIPGMETIRKEIAEQIANAEHKIEAAILRQNIRMAIARLAVLQPEHGWSEVLEVLDK